MAEISEKTKMIEKIKNYMKNNQLDGYIIPKNDNYFTEFSKINNLQKLTGFTGSAGFALVLKEKNYLFVDGRYTLQANMQSGKNFKILQIPYKWPKDVIKEDYKKIGFDPNLFTQKTLNKYFENKSNLIPLSFKFKNHKTEIKKNFFLLKDKIIGENFKSKLNRVIFFLKKRKIKYFYVSSSENVCWLLNIRGFDLPNSPLANCKVLITDEKKIYLFTNLIKISKIKKKFDRNIFICDEDQLFQIILQLKKGNFGIDENTCSVFEEQLIKSKYKIILKNDPIYNLKSIKNSTEINNMKKAHVIDGVAVTKFLYWFKKNKKIVNEQQVEKKLETFRKRSKLYLYPSFETIAGSGPNGAIIHYRSNKNTNRSIKKNDVLLIDSGGQYKWGTTDITRTTCYGSISQKIKDNFTRVLKGHISVATCDLKKYQNGNAIDRLARKYLKLVNLNYAHGTGHGVGFFLNVHEGPQAISSNNKIKLEKGMILSNEPGFYLNNKYGIRIENLIYIDEIKNKKFFKNLTYAPIDLDLVNFDLITKKEREYLFSYHLDVYKKISKFLNSKEKKWLVGLIK